MADISFLKLHPNIEVAQDLGESPHATLRYTPQIQLLPFDPQPYVQVTSSAIPLSFSPLTYKAYIVRCDNGFEVDATEHIELRDLIPGQVLFRFAYLPWDFGISPVYLKIDRYGDGLKKYYSNKFLITDYNAHLTSRIDYLDRTKPIPGWGYNPPEGEFQSIRLQFYFDNVIDATDVETYYQITTSQTVTPRVSVKEYSKWKTQLFNAWTLSRIARALYEGRCYINQTRNYIMEGLERKEREGMSNISENVFLTDPDENDTINIIPVIIGDEWQTIPFLSSSDQHSSCDFLSSQSDITIPIP